MVTGGTGFVGSNLARRLVRDGHDVHLLVRPGYTSWRIEPIRLAVQLHEVDLLDPASVENVAQAVRGDWIFHLAVHGAYPSQTNVQDILRTNIMGTVNLVEAYLKIGFNAFINTGSSSEYGYCDEAPSEEAALHPNSHYAVSKAAATWYCRYAAERHNVPIPTLRLYSVYGPYEEPTRLIPSLIVRGLAGTFPPLVDPQTARDFVYVADVIDAYLLAATRQHPEPGAVYNVGSGVQTTLRQVVDIARVALAIPGEAEWSSMPRRQWDTATWVSNSQKIERTLGWRASCRFADGFTATVQWLRHNPKLLALYEDRLHGR